MRKYTLTSVKTMMVGYHHMWLTTEGSRMIVLRRNVGLDIYDAGSLQLLSQIPIDEVSEWPCTFLHDSTRARAYVALVGRVLSIDLVTGCLLASCLLPHWESENSAFLELNDIDNTLLVVVGDENYGERPLLTVHDRHTLDQSKILPVKTAAGIDDSWRLAGLRLSSDRSRLCIWFWNNYGDTSAVELFEMPSGQKTWDFVWDAYFSQEAPIFSRDGERLYVLLRLKDESWEDVGPAVLAASMYSTFDDPDTYISFRDVENPHRPFLAPDGRSLMIPYGRDLTNDSPGLLSVDLSSEEVHDLPEGEAEVFLKTQGSRDDGGADLTRGLRYSLSDDSDAIHMWSLNSGDLITRHPLAFSPGGVILSSDGSRVYVWETQADGSVFEIFRVDAAPDQSLDSPRPRIALELPD